MKEVELKAAMFDLQQELAGTQGALNLLASTVIETFSLDKQDSLESLIEAVKGLKTE